MRRVTFHRGGVWIVGIGDRVEFEIDRDHHIEAATQTAPLTANGTPPTARETNPPTAPSMTSTPPSDVRLPATFTVGVSGALSPPKVTAPAHIPVLLTVVSGDGRAHRAALRTPVPHELTVAAHGRASVLLTGLKNGRYVLEIDGAPKGALVVGGAPGPKPGSAKRSGSRSRPACPAGAIRPLRSRRAPRAPAPRT